MSARVRMLVLGLGLGGSSEVVELVPVVVVLVGGRRVVGLLRGWIVSLLLLS